MSRIELYYYRSQIHEMNERVEQTRPVVQQYGLPTQRAAFLRSTLRPRRDVENKTQLGGRATWKE